MIQAEFIAPKVYNIVWEIEKYASTEKIALKWEEQNGQTSTLTFKELNQLVNIYAFQFLSKGLTKGDKVFVMMPRCAETYAVYLAILKIGAIIIPGSELLREKDIEYRLDHGEVRAVIVHSLLLEAFENQTNRKEILYFLVDDEADQYISLNKNIHANPQVSTVETSCDDVAFISYTSGTTGNPKGVVHTHSWGYSHIRITALNWLDITEDDTVWATAGPGWQKWIWSPFLATLGSGATGFFYQGKFDANTYLALLQKHEISVLCCTPTEYRFMAKADHLEQYHFPHLRSAVSAGEPLNQEVIRTFQTYFGVNVRDGYGQTENTLLIGTLKGMEAKVGSMGKPTPGNIVEVVDEDGLPVSPGVVGDIAVHKLSPSLFKGYYKDESRTNSQQRGDYYITGDRAKKDDDGYFWFEGRSDDIIISSGYTIGPFEVEDALVKHELVRECAVVASPHQLRGSVVKAFVVLKSEPIDEEALVLELQEFVKIQTAPYKYPRIIEFVEELPKTISGKIRRIELRDLEKERNFF
jgi:acetyl-CoA synthetase